MMALYEFTILYFVINSFPHKSKAQTELGTGASPEGKKYFILSTKTVQYVVADRICEANGMFLPQFTSWEELEYIKDGSNFGNVWVDYRSSPGNKLDFVSQSGQSMGDFFRDGDPNYDPKYKNCAADGEDVFCARMNGEDVIDASCDQCYNFVCQEVPATTTVLTTTTTEEPTTTTMLTTSTTTTKAPTTTTTTTATPETTDAAASTTSMQVTTSMPEGCKDLMFKFDCWNHAGTVFILSIVLLLVLTIVGFWDILTCKKKNYVKEIE